ncbi:MAG: hypothetical protein IJD14_05180 [Christensenellaceae bacterium]|nr:hypothetical protein [Christensenellaceae bacterium]
MKKLLIILLPIIFIASGCSAKSLENTAAVKAVAFDSAGENIRMTALVIDADEEKPFVTVSVEEKNMSALTVRLNDYMEKEPFFTQCEAALFSADLLKKGAGELIEWLALSPLSNNSVLLAAMRGDADEAFSYTEGLFKDPAVDISRMMKNSWKYGSGICITAKEAHSALKSISNTTLIPIFDISGEEDKRSLFADGAGILKNGMFTKELTKDELFGVKIVASQNGAALGTNLPVKINRVKTKTKADGFYISYDIRAFYELSDKDGYDYPVKEMEEYIEKCVLKAALCAKKEGDFMGLLVHTLNRDRGLKKSFTGDIETALSKITVTADVKTVRKGGTGA